MVKQSVLLMGTIFSSQRFGRPQLLAATLLLVFVGECAWLVAHEYPNSHWTKSETRPHRGRSRAMASGRALQVRHPSATLPLEPRRPAAMRSLRSPSFAALVSDRCGSRLRFPPLTGFAAFGFGLPAPRTFCLGHYWARRCGTVSRRAVRKRRRIYCPRALLLFAGSDSQQRIVGGAAGCCRSLGDIRSRISPRSPCRIRSMLRAKSCCGTGGELCFLAYRSLLRSARSSGLR